MRNRFKALIAGSLAVAAMLLGAQIAPARIIVQSGMGTIGEMVRSGRLAGAVRLLKYEYRFDAPDGLRALHAFSLLVLRQGLNDADPFERCYVATALAAYGDWGGGAVIFDALNSPNLLIQKAALEGLATAGNGDALKILERFYHLAGPISRSIAIQALAEVKIPSAMPILVEATKDPNSTGTYWAVNGLGHIGDREALPFLQTLLVKSIDPMVRTEVAHSMLLLGDRSPDSTETLEEQLGSGDSDVAAEAALGLGDAHDPLAATLLQDILTNKRMSGELRLSAAVALTHYGNAQGMPMLMETLNGQSRLTSFLPGMLDHLDFAVGRPVLLRALSSSEQQVRLTAYEVFGRNGGEAEIGVLSDAMARTTEPMDLAQIAWAFGRIDRPESIPILLELVQNPAPEVRDTAADSLARLADNLARN